MIFLSDVIEFARGKDKVPRRRRVLRAIQASALPLTGAIAGTVIGNRIGKRLSNKLLVKGGTKFDRVAREVSDGLIGYGAGSAGLTAGLAGGIYLNRKTFNRPRNKTT